MMTYLQSMKNKIIEKAKGVVSMISSSNSYEFDVDTLIEQLKLCQILKEKDLQTLCNKVKEILREEPNVVPLNAPLTICGDVHGQFPDLIELLDIGGKIGQAKFLFLGDYVDRGHYSTQTISILFAYKVKYPQKVTLLRGNHESRFISKQYGFYDQVQKKYGSVEPWTWITDTFDFLPICSIVDKNFLCMHGGLSPSIETIDQIRSLDRFQEVQMEGPLTDLLWSDPSQNPGFSKNNGRGIGHLFGQDMTQKFNKVNRIKSIARAHQVCMKGYDINHDKKVMTIFSAPNYCYRCGNKGAVLDLDSHHHGNFLVFGHTTEFDEHDPQKQIPKFFT